MSALYFLVWAAYRALYALRLLRPARLPCPVISVGNLTVGGSGKTTVVIGLARWLSQRGYHVAVLLRGYRGRRRRATAAVSDGRSLLMSVEEAGDEAVLLAKALPGTPVLVGKDRGRSARLAIEKLGADFIVLDDGFQYWRLHKDVELVLWDATTPARALRLLPAGVLREPMRALGRATHLGITRSDLAPEARALAESLRRQSGLTVFLTRHSPGEVIPVHEPAAPPGRLSGKPFVAFAGIGNFGAFLETVRRAGFAIAAQAEYPDHHPYSQQDLTQLESLAREHDAEALLTTTKDAVRLERLKAGLPIYALEVHLQSHQETPTESLWQDLLEAATHAPPQRRPRSLRKWMENRAGYLALRGVSALAALLPERAACWLGRQLGDLVYALSGSRRRIALRNLTLAFGKQMTPGQLRTLCRRHFRFIGQTLAEFLRMPLLSGEDLHARMQMVDEHFLADAYARGRGVILLTAHFGNWEHLGTRIAQDYPLAGLARAADDVRTHRLVDSVRQGAGAKVIQTDDVRAALRLLRNGEILAILLDQNTATNAVFVDFFGKKAATATGPVVLAKRTGAALVPAFAVRVGPGRSQAYFLPPLEISPDKDPATVTAEVQRCTAVIEEWVRRYPDHWLWMHDRWRTRPPEESPPGEAR